MIAWFRPVQQHSGTLVKKGVAENKSKLHSIHLLFWVHPETYDKRMVEFSNANFLCIEESFQGVALKDLELQ